MTTKTKPTPPTPTLAAARKALSACPHLTPAERRAFKRHLSEVAHTRHLYPTGAKDLGHRQARESF
jgi:hypothetical protein